MAQSIRQIIKIDEDKCNGCGLCVPQCAEGAIQIIDGKARLVSETFCDGLGACLGHCPQDAITIEERPAEEFSEDAVSEHLAKSEPKPADGGCPGNAPGVLQTEPSPPAGGCPGTAMREMAPAAAKACCDDAPPPSMLGHWPVQLALIPPQASFLAGADLVICADCAPFAVADFHNRYLTGKAVVVGCPKLDDLGAYRVKLGDMFRAAKPKRITVLRMEVPCCGGLASAAVEARAEAAPDTPMEVHVVGIRGGIEKHIVD